MADITEQMIAIIKAHGFEILEISRRAACAVVEREGSHYCVGLNATEIRALLGY